MGYASNTKFSPLTDDINLSIDGCGGTHENKYYVNGTYIDLCGLPIEEYMKNPFCDCGNNGNKEDEDVEDKKPVNEVLVKSFTDETGLVYYQAIAKFAVTSDIKIIVSSTTDVIVELNISTGEVASSVKQGSTMDFATATININEDDNYQYITISEKVKMTYEIYHTASLLKDIDVFNNNFEKNVIDEDTSYDMNFLIPGTNFNYNELEELDDYNKFCIENQYCLLIYLPKVLYDNKQYLIRNSIGVDITNKFTLHKNLSINNVDFVCIVEKGGEDISPFVPLYKEDLNYVYNITINI